MMRSRWSFIDTIAWGLAQGLDENAQEVQSWAFGYGFSYLNRRRIALEVPYDDRNMGEDFVFIRKLQAHKNDRAVQLYHDAFGICVHIQHGGNTSNTFPIREVSSAEVVELAELARMVDPSLPHRPPRRLRQKRIKCHTRTEDYVVECDPGPTVAQLLKSLQDTVSMNCEDLKVHIVPPPSHAEQQEREDKAAAVLGVVPLMEKLAATKSDLNVESVANRRRKLLLQRVKLAMRMDDRVPLTVKELWLATPDEAEAEAADVKALELEGGLKKDEDVKMIFIEVEIKATSAKKFFKQSRGFQVMIQEGSNVADFRSTIGPDLPPTARLFAEGREGQLQEKEPVPERVTTTEYIGKRSFYALFTKEQCSANLTMLKSFLTRKEIQKKLDSMQKESNTDGSWRIALSQLLMTEAYPAIFRHYGAELEGVDSVLTILSGMREVGNFLELQYQQLEVEILMRNRGSVMHCMTGIFQIHKDRGLPEPQILPRIEKWLQGGSPLRPDDIADGIFVKAAWQP